MSSIDNTRARLLNSRTKQVLFVVGVMSVVLLVAFMIYAILVTPSKQPYRDALAQYKNVYNANIALITKGASLNASGATDEQFTKNTEAVKDALVTLETENEALGKHLVLTSGEGKTQYEAFTKKLSSYIAYNNDMVTAMQQVRPVIFECSRSMTSITQSAAGATAMQACADNLRALTTVPNEDYQQLVKASHGLYADFAANIAAKAALADPEGADSVRAATLDEEQEQILEALNGASKTFSVNLQKHKQAVDITDAAIALDQYLSKKANIF